MDCGFHLDPAVISTLVRDAIAQYFESCLGAIAGRYNLCGLLYVRRLAIQYNVLSTFLKSAFSDLLLSHLSE